VFLNEMLKARRRARQTAEIKAAYDEFLARLSAAQVGAQARKAGDRMPDFLLPNAEGRLVDSADLLARGPVVVTFIRGQWYPYCALTLEALEAVLPELEAAGGTLVAMTPETGGLALATKRERGLHYDVLVDVDLAVAMAFGIVFRTPPLYAALLSRAGLDLGNRSGNPGWFLPIPATFVVRGDGVIHRAWVNIDFIERPEPTDIIETLRRLR